MAKLAWSKSRSGQPPHFSVLNGDKMLVYELIMGEPSLLSMCAMPHVPRCADWSCDPSNAYLAAVGLSSGSVMLCNYGSERKTIGSSGNNRESQMLVRCVIEKECVPTHYRPCNDVSWNPINHSHFAAGLAKTGRSGASVLIWDASQLTGRSRQTAGNGMARHDVLTKPVRQYAESDGIASLTWKPDSQTCLVVGTSHKMMRVYDLRAKSSSPVTSLSAHSKSVMGVSFSPCQSNMILSYSEDGIVKVWDMRALGTGGPVVSVDAYEASIRGRGNFRSSLGGSKGETNTGSLFGGVDSSSRQNTSKGERGKGKNTAIAEPKASALGATSPKLGSIGSSSSSSVGSSVIKGQGCLADVKWSRSHPYQFATACYDSQCVSLWNVAHGTAAFARSRGDSVGSVAKDIDEGRRNGGSKVFTMSPTRHRFVSAPILSFVWQQAPTGSRDERLMVATQDGNLIDLALYDQMPLAIGVGGHVSIGCQEFIISDKNPVTKSPSGQGGPMRSEFVGGIIRRAKAGYLLDPGKNVLLLRNESKSSADVASDDKGEGGRPEHSLDKRRRDLNSSPSLIDAWSSVDRAFQIGQEAILRRGITAAVRAQGTSSAEKSITTTTLGFKSYTSPERSAALSLCGWFVPSGISTMAESQTGGASVSGVKEPEAIGGNSSSGSLSSIASQNESQNLAFREFILSIEKQSGESCRAAALAVYHGYQQLAVSILQTAALRINEVSPRSSELMTLVAMSVAGFPLKRNPIGPQKLWRDMAHKLCDTLEQAALDAAKVEHNVSDQQDREGPLSSRALMYLKALVFFLCSPAAWVGTHRRGDGTSSVYFRRLNQGSQQIDAVAAMAAAASDVTVNAGATDGSIDRLFGYQSILDPSQCASHSTGATGIRLSDQIGFACKYLPDAALKKYLLVATAEAKLRGDISAIILTGSNPSAYTLFQKYIDTTGDLQSAALLSCAVGIMSVSQKESKSENSNTSRAVSKGDLTGKRFQAWIELYRDMLNRERLWIQRAQFDVARAHKGRDRRRQANSVVEGRKLGIRSLSATRPIFRQAVRSEKPSQTPHEDVALANLQAPQLSARCNFCSSTFQLSDLLGNASVRRSDWLSKQPASMMCCPMPKCKQPLPRCAICLLPMTVQNPFLYLPKSSSPHQAKPMAWSTNNPFDEWFLWCQTCHHGGHKACLANWYERHAKCPVSNCSCVCSILDG